SKMACFRHGSSGSPRDCVLGCGMWMQEGANGAAAPVARTHTSQSRDRNHNNVIWHDTFHGSLARSRNGTVFLGRSVKAEPIWHENMVNGNRARHCLALCVRVVTRAATYYR